MHRSNNNQPRRDESGFVLITSLLFLVIITLLALSGITSSTLQQKMTNNTSEKASSLQAANNTLNHVEMLIRQMDQPPAYPESAYKIVTGTDTPQVKRVTGSGDFTIPFKEKHIAPSVWLKDSTWETNGGDYAARTFDKLPGGRQTMYRLTYHYVSLTDDGKPSGLHPSHAAKTENLIYYFRITARSMGIDGQTPAVTQSVFRCPRACFFESKKNANKP